MQPRPITIGTSVRFETAHRQYGDLSKCGFLHGHNWKADVRITAGKVGPIGYIVDFKDVKEVIREMDHKILIFEGDTMTNDLMAHKQKLYRLTSNPTCENLAYHILDLLIGTCCHVESLINIHVKVWENEESYAEVSLR